MGLVDDHQIPLTRPYLLDQLVATGQMIEPSDQQIMTGERVTETGRLDRLAGQQLVLSLRHQTAGRHDKAAAHIAAQRQLLQQQARHDGLARPRIISQAEPPANPATLAPSSGRSGQPCGLPIRGPPILGHADSRPRRFSGTPWRGRVAGSASTRRSRRCDGRHRTSANRFRRWAVVGIRTGTNARPTHRKAVP